jgi:hypothetical protein
VDELTQTNRWTAVTVQAIVDKALAIPTEDLVSLANALPAGVVDVHGTPLDLRGAVEAVLSLRVAGKAVYGDE